MKRGRMLVAGIGLALLMTACGEPIDVGPAPDPTGTNSTTDAREVGGDDLATTTTAMPLTPGTTQPDDSSDTTGGSTPTTIASTTTTIGGSQSDGEVPAGFLDAVLDDASAVAGVSRADLDVVEAASYQWPDGSLGCPEPGQAYTQAITPGYRVVVGHESDLFDYRLSERGSFRLCSSVLTIPRDNS